MKLLSKCFLAILLLTVSAIGRAEMLDEEYRTLISHLRSNQFGKGYRIAKYYADGGSVKAYVVLAQMHMNGDFVEHNKTLGKYNLQMASDNGDGYASSD